MWTEAEMPVASALGRDHPSEWWGVWWNHQEKHYPQTSFSCFSSGTNNSKIVYGNVISVSMYKFRSSSLLCTQSNTLTLYLYVRWAIDGERHSCKITSIDFSHRQCNGRQGYCYWLIWNDQLQRQCIHNLDQARKKKIHKLHHPAEFSFSSAPLFKVEVSDISYRLDEEVRAPWGALRSWLMTDIAPWHTSRLMFGAVRMFSSALTKFWTWEEFRVEISWDWFRSWFTIDWALAVIVVSTN